MVKAELKAARVVVVTGGTLGVGRAIVEAFAAEGWNIGFIARDAARVQQLQHELERLGVTALGIAADVADTAAVQAAASRFEQDLGPIHAWINNAMVSVLGPAPEITAKEHRRVIDVTYMGAVNGTLAALTHMRQRNQGTIIQINSVLGLRPFPLQSAYAAAKGAVRNFTDSLRGELRHQQSAVQLTTVYLPTVNTPQFDGMVRNHIGRRQKAPPPVFSPELCAQAVLFAAMHPRREVYVGRTSLQIIMLNLLAHLLPTLPDRVAAGGWDAQLQQQAAGCNEGNLFSPVSGPTRMHGPFTTNMTTTTREFFTSRQLAVVLSVVALTIATLAVGGLLALIEVLL